MKRSSKLPYLLLLPIMMMILWLILYPILMTFSFSLQSFKMTEPENTRFLGIGNYKQALGDFGFQAAVGNTLIILLVVIVLSFVCSLLVALLLKKDSPLSGFLTAIAIIPWALPPIVNGIVWSFIFYPGFGLLNKILHSLGIIQQPIIWGSGRIDSLIMAGIVVSWRIIPFCAVILLANMQAIDPELFEAARVDGASEGQIFRSITLPLLIPTFGIVLTNMTIAGINVFDEVVSLIGYREMGQTVQIFNYNQTFSFLNFGYGSAISYIIMLASGVVGYFYIKNVGGNAS